MKNYSIKPLLFILVLTLISAFIALPKSIDQEVELFGAKKQIVFNKPDLNFKLGPLEFNEDLYLHKGMDLAGGVHLVFRAKTESLEVDKKEKALESLRDNIERRVNMFGVSESSVWIAKALEEDHLIVEIPGDIDPGEAIGLIGQTARLEFKLETEIAPEATPTATIYDVFAIETGLSGANLKEALVTFNQNTGEPQVAIEFDDEGKEIFADITTQNTGKSLAIFLDDFPLSAPVIKEPILNGQASISGNFEMEQAKLLVTQLNAGALPVEIEVIQQKKVDPTLGQSSISKGVIAGTIGIVAVGFFMIGYYGFLGFLAVIGLIIYTLISIALYKLIPVTLTMSGVAGFLLSLGMAVDSNILIFERMREEIRAGKPKLMAMELGFGRAWDSIRDANVCTLITSFVLFNPFEWSFFNTSSVIKGFALTLGIGVILEMFTGIVVVRTIMRSFYKGDSK